MGISALERHRLNREALEQLFHKFILSPSPADKNAKLPSPTEIRDRLEQDIKNMFSLPVLPQVYHQIAALDRNPRSEIRDWISASGSAEQGPSPPPGALAHLRLPGRDQRYQ